MLHESRAILQVLNSPLLRPQYMFDVGCGSAVQSRTRNFLGQVDTDGETTHYRS